MHTTNEPVSLSRREIGMSLLAAFLVLMLVAAPGATVLAGSASGEGRPEQANAPGERASSPGTVIRVRFEAEPGTLNPWLQYSIYNQFLAGYIYESLLTQDPQTFQWRGRLADKWSENVVAAGSAGNQLRLTFHLRAGARFHDGQPVTADDVVFSLLVMKNPFLRSPLSSYFADMESCRAVGADSVEIVYSHPYWPAKKNVGELPILPRHIYDPKNLLSSNPEGFVAALKSNSANQNPVGSGPYRVVSWERGSSLVLEPAGSAATAARPAAPRIVFRFIADHVAALQALKNGEIDFIPRLDPELFDAEQKNPEFAARFKSSAYYTEYFDFVAWNMQRPFFKDKRVRQALGYGALDRQQFLDTVLGGRGIIVSGSQYYFGPAYNKAVLPYPFDLKKAQGLLVQAGWIDHNGDGTRDKEGVEFRFELMLRSGNKLARQRAAIMQQALAKLQIQMTIRELELGAFAQSVGRREFDACTLGWSLELESDPYQLWHSSQVGESGSNLPGLSMPAVDRLIERSRSLINEQERHRIFFELHSILHEEQPYLFLYCRPNLAVYSSKLQGVRFYPIRPGYRIEEWQVIK